MRELILCETEEDKSKAQKTGSSRQASRHREGKREGKAGGERERESERCQKPTLTSVSKVPVRQREKERKRC